MKTTESRAMDFIRKAGLDWRRAMYIDCIFCTKTKRGCGGYLMFPDADAKPMLIQVREMAVALGYRIETTECCGRLLKSQFEKLYASYLVWTVDDGKACPLAWLSNTESCLGPLPIPPTHVP